MSRNPAWLGEPVLQQFFAATRAAGGEARVVGGAVRDFLTGRSGGDLDLASTLLPEQTMTLAAENGWKAIPTGIAHGTVTLVLPGRVMEVTTLRRDVETDGRHAKIAYTDRFEEDAARRDFTINALYMDAAGEVFDFFDGQKDLAARRVRFIGDAATRIAEDGLRMLRYFRFLATHGQAPAEEEALEAIRQHKKMLQHLSGERIAAEMKKLLTAADPVYALEEMKRSGLFEEMDAELSSATPWPKNLTPLLALEKAHGLSPNPWVRLAGLFPWDSRGNAALLAERWKLSRAEAKYCAAICLLQENKLFGIRSLSPYTVDAARVKEWLRTEDREVVAGRILLSALDRGLKAKFDALLALVQEWPIPVFPVTAKDLMVRSFSEGPLLGQALRKLEQQWVKSGYTLGKEALLKKL